MKTFHFISGLPRSGSTLLCNVLAQNPRFHATHTSGCLDVMFGVRNVRSQLVEYQAHPDPTGLTRILRAILEAEYDLVKKPVIFEKSRGWTAYVEMIEEVLNRKCKIIAPIRNIPDVLASMEKLHRTTAKTNQPPGEAQNYFQMQTVAGRCASWCEGSQLVGLAYNRIKDAIQRGFRDRFYFVDFDKLTSEPQKTITGIYDFLEEAPYQHNFEKVEQVTVENDEVHGYAGLHTIKPKITYKPSHAAEIIGKDLAIEYSKLNLEV
jgi:sulfotransferase